MQNSWFGSWDQNKFIKKIKDNHKINILKKNTEWKDCTKPNPPTSQMSKDEIIKNKLQKNIKKNEGKKTIH